MTDAKKNLYITILVLFVLALPLLSLAQGVGTNPPSSGVGTNPPSNNKENVTIINPIESKTISGLFKTILEGVIKILTPVVALAIIYSGFLFVSAQGNSEKLGDAKRALTYTLIGAAILLGSWALAQLVFETVLAL